MTRALRRTGLLAAAAAVLVAAGCSHKNTLRPNIPPETYLFVQGPVDTLNHRVHLYWYGTDPDGEVTYFKYRWIYTPGPANPPWLTIPGSKPGVYTDSIFTVFTGDSAFVNVMFQIRAFDNGNDSDATPAFENFVLGNVPPQVTIISPFSVSLDTTYASVSFSWDVKDLDGGGPGLHYRIWLDGNRANYDSTDQQTFTVPSSRFLQGGTYLSGPRTLFIQAVDDGGSAGPITSMSWYVRAPAATLRQNRGRLLIIDDLPSNGANNLVYDNFYQGVIQSAVPAKLPANSWSVLRPEFNPNIFRTARDFAQTLRQFEAVLWYRGQAASIPPLLQTYQDSLGVWLDNGGRLYLDGLFLVDGLRSPGALTADFMRNHLGSDFLFNTFNSSLGDSTAGWSNVAGASGSVMRTSVYRGVFRTLVIMPANGLNQTGIRGFGVRDTSNVALWAMAGQLNPPNVGYELPVGLTVPQPNGGRLVLLSLPLRAGAPAAVTPILNAILFDPPPAGLLPP